MYEGWLNALMCLLIFPQLNPLWRAHTSTTYDGVPWSNGVEGIFLVILNDPHNRNDVIIIFQNAYHLKVWE